MNALRLISKFNPEQKSKPMHGDNLLDLRQTCSQVCFDPLHIRQHAIVFDCFESRCYRGHRQHAAAESRSQIVFFDVRSDHLADEASANRDTAAQRFRERYDVRHDTTARLTACKEPFTGASHTSLYFVVNQ